MSNANLTETTCIQSTHTTISEKTMYYVSTWHLLVQTHINGTQRYSKRSMSPGTSTQLTLGPISDYLLEWHYTAWLMRTGQGNSKTATKTGAAQWLISALQHWGSWLKSIQNTICMFSPTLQRHVGRLIGFLPQTGPSMCMY